jgi:Domain of unknown function (DUF4375)
MLQDSVAHGHARSKGRQKPWREAFRFCFSLSGRDAIVGRCLLQRADAIMQPISSGERQAHSSERDNRPFVGRRSCLLLSTVLFCSITSCSGQPDRAAAPDQPSPNHATDEGKPNHDGDFPIGHRPRRPFNEYLKNPELFREEARRIEQPNAVKAATPKELETLVSAMGQRRLEHEELQKLTKAGNKAIPLLLAAVRDNKFLFHRYGDSVLDGSTMETALDLLEPFGLPEVAVLEPALRHPDERFRELALYHLARCGNDEAIDVLRAGLKSKSESCRTYTLMGLAFLKGSPRGSKKFRAALFEASLPLLDDNEYGPADSAPRALLALDPARARLVLLGPAVFRADNKNIYQVLQALKDASVPVPGSQLRSLLAGLKKKATDFPFDSAYADGLILLARMEGSRCKDLIADAETWGKDRVKQAAAEASAIVAGVTDADGFVNKLYERKGVQGLTEPQLNYLALSWLDAEVNNGGFSQYYFNSSGDLAGHAVKAARAVGAHKLAKIVEDANALFGKKGPDPDRDKRMDQVSKINLDALSKLDKRYYKCPERLNEILPKYAAAHAEAFRTPR